MNRIVTALLAIAVVSGSLAPAHSADAAPELTFTQDGKDLIVSIKKLINNSPYVVWAHSTILDKDVHLQYYVFQNRDMLVRGANVRSVKEIEIKWRLVGHTKGDATYHVENNFLPSSAELKELLPKLQKLMETGERFKKELKKENASKR